MPSVDANKAGWDAAYDWTQRGDEWSAEWGGVDMQWYGAVLPRIHVFVPTGVVLEIAPGYGRWTDYLRRLSERMVLVDLAEVCIESCKERFKQETHIEYHVNDGKSLAMVEDGSIDFVYSFDSLVHVEEDVIEAYLSQIASKLKPDGVGMIHHSNLGECARYFDWVREIPRPLRHFLRGVGAIEQHWWRAFSMTAGKFERFADAAGLQCISQEIINWNTRRLIDCISIFTRQGSRWARPNRVIRNKRFVAEAKQLAELSALYGVASLSSNGQTKASAS